MNSERFNYFFNVGDTVYHSTQDGDRGIVLDVSYSLRNGFVRYEVVFGRRSEDNIWCVEEELSSTKVF